MPMSARDGGAVATNKKAAFVRLIRYYLLYKWHMFAAFALMVGSNLFNIFFVLGCSASITPLHLGGINNLDLLVMVGSSILLWLFGVFFGTRIITRVEGSILIACYVGYTAWLIYSL